MAGTWLGAGTRRGPGPFNIRYDTCRSDGHGPVTVNSPSVVSEYRDRDGRRPGLWRQGKDSGRVTTVTRVTVEF